MSERTQPEDGWLIYKAGRGWYRPKAQGYTSNPAEAGRYSHADALSYSHPNGHDGPRDGMTIKHESEVHGALRTQPEPADLVERIAHLPAKADGTLVGEIMPTACMEGIIKAVLAAIPTAEQERAQIVVLQEAIANLSTSALDALKPELNDTIRGWEHYEPEANWIGDAHIAAVYRALLSLIQRGDHQQETK